MSSLILLYEQFSNGSHVDYLIFLNIGAILTGLLVITVKNPIVSVLYLIGLFLCIAMYLIFLGINFIGLSYLLVYVGAVSILFLFILMLINIRVSEIAISTNNIIPLAIIIGSCFFYSLIQASPESESLINIYSNLPLDDYNYNSVININEINIKFKNTMADQNSVVSNYPILKEIYKFKLSNLLSQSWVNNIIDYSHIVALGNILYTHFPLWLLITSLILLLAMVGSIIITIKDKQK